MISVGGAMFPLNTMSGGIAMVVNERNSFVSIKG